VFPGWWVLTGAVTVQLLPAGLMLSAYGAYVVVMQAEFGWSATAFAAAFSLQQVATGLLGPLHGWLLQRFGPVRIIRVGMLFFAGGMVLLSQVGSYTGFVLALILAAIGSSLGGFLSTNTVAVNWFERRRSMSLALIQTGISAGGLMVPLIVWSLQTNGWRLTAMISGLLVLVVGLPLSRLIRDRPEDLGLTPDGEPPQRSRRAVPQFSAAEALRTRAFWLLAAGHALALAVVFAVLAHLVVFLNDEVGLSLEVAGYLFTLMTVVTIIGQLVGGLLADRFNKRIIAGGAMIGHAAGLAVLALGASLPATIGFGLLHGFAWGLRGPVMQALRADLFGPRAFAQIMGLTSPLLTIGMFSGPLIVGVLVDRSGSHAPGFLVVAALAALGSTFFFLVRPPAARG
jgi:sugar phosphate permease